jgi:chitodextrinase
MARRWMLLSIAVVMAGGLVTPAAPSAAAVAALTRYPYLTDVVAGFATVNFGTDQSSTSASVTYGVEGTEPCTAHQVAATRTSITVSSKAEYQWRATLPVQSDTRYCYRVFLGSGPGTDLLGTDASPGFVSQLPAGSTTSFSFAVFGDWGQADASGNPDQANLMRLIASSGARFAISTGDVGYPAGSQTSYGDLQQTGSNVSGVFGPQFWTVPGRSIPLFNVEGNHSPDVNHITNWPSYKAAELSGGRFTMETYCCVNGTTSKSYASAWYAFDAGVARFYILDAAWAGSNLGTGTQYSNDYAVHWTPSSAEYQWLVNDLAAHPGSLKFAAFHYPLYSDQSSQDSDTSLQGAGSLEGLLGRYGVTMAFNGHAHVYQRNRAQAGIVSYVTGGGGAEVASMGGRGCGAYNAYGIGWKPSTNSGSACGAAPVPDSPTRVFHFLLVEVNGSTVKVTPTDELGRTFDVQTYAFGGSPADTQPPTAPTGLTATATSPTSVGLSWSASTDNVGVTSYTVRRGGAVVATVPGNQTGYTDTVAAGTAYQYVVTASDAAGNTSPQSAPATVTTPPGSGTGTSLTFAPAADAYVYAGSPTTNFGASTTVQVDNSPVKRTLMKFSVAGTNGCTVSKATLRLYDVNAATKGGDVHRLPDTSWQEGTVTWNNQPSPDPTVVASLGAVAPGNTYAVDVTPLVSGDGVVSLMLTSPSSDGADYASREATTAAQRPQLVVDCAAG